jgi:meso-butanediol dehydrogenase / (S,S)-butanediol dehydrogenase / diacetyl reductase
MGDLSGRIALVTGAASGIGRATSIRFAGAGAIVIATDRNVEALAAVRDDLGHGGHVLAGLDVTEEGEWIDLAARIERDLARLDILVNNAGFGAFRSIADTTLEQWRAITSVNLDSVFLGTKHMMPLLAKAEAGGSIINMSSIRGIAAAPFASSYCASKGGVRLFTKAAALECAAAGKGVRVNSIHPGHVVTPLTAKLHADKAEQPNLMADTPLGRAADPEEIASAILFLASDNSGYMTGAELVVDGGSTAR